MKTIAPLQAVQYITINGAIQLPDVDGKSFLNHTHLPFEDLTPNGLFAKCYILAYSNGLIARELNQFTWTCVSSICTSEGPTESEKVAAVRTILNNTGLTLRTVVQSWKSAGVLRSILKEWIKIREEAGVEHMHFSKLRMHLNDESTDFHVYKEACDMIFSEILLDPCLM